MTLAIVTSAQSLARSPVELIVLVVTIFLFSLRAATGILHLDVPPRVARRIDITAFSLVLVFVALVILRFRALA